MYAFVLQWGGCHCRLLPAITISCSCLSVQPCTPSIFCLKHGNCELQGILRWNSWLNRLSMCKKSKGNEEFTAEELLDLMTPYGHTMVRSGTRSRAGVQDHGWGRNAGVPSSRSSPQFCYGKWWIPQLSSMELVWRSFTVKVLCKFEVPNTYLQQNTYSTLTFFSMTHPQKWTATFGALLKPPTLKRSVKTIIIHEKYLYPEHDYDIALVQLSKRVEFTSSIHRVCLPEPSQTFPYNTYAVITGWGALTNDGESWVCQVTCMVHKQRFWGNWYHICRHMWYNSKPKVCLVVGISFLF